MTREEFMEIRDWGELRDALYNLGYTESADDIRNGDDRNEAIEEVVDYWRDYFGSWQSLGNYLENLGESGGDDWYTGCLDCGPDDWYSVDDPYYNDRDIIEYIRDFVAGYGDDIWDDEDEDDEDGDSLEYHFPEEVFIYEEPEEEFLEIDLTLEIGEVYSEAAEAETMLHKISERKSCSVADDPPPF